MLIIGLTGGVASGKNFVASRFKKLRIPVFDADLEVHKLLSSDGEIFLRVKKLFPRAVLNGKIDRGKLGEEVFNDDKKLQNLEQIIYPKLRNEENLFLKNCRRNYQKIAVLNIPLLFEKNGHKRCDLSIAVIAPMRIQLQRFKARYLKNNSNQNDFAIEEKFKKIIKNQFNNLQRKKLADFIIQNGLGKAFCQSQINLIVKKFCT
jgi:dephospho-CoA kinase